MPLHSPGSRRWAMATIGYKLSSEEFGPRELVRFGRLAEDAGFRFALISDHFHPWTDRQGQSPFVWSVIGGAEEGRAPSRRRGGAGRARSRGRAAGTTKT